MSQESIQQATHDIEETSVEENDNFFKRLFSQKKILFSFIVIVFVIVIGIIGPWITTHDPNEPYFDALLHPPSSEHWLGTDNLGRDTFSRLIYGTRVTLQVATIAVSITLVIGTLIGLIAGYVGGIIDNILMRIMDVLLAMPSIVLAMAIVAVLGPSLRNAMIAVGISSIPSFARLTRSATLSIKSLTYVEASHAIGTSHIRIIFKQILPNIMGTVLVYASLNVGIAVLDTAALSFIGLGAQPPTPEWGTMLSDGKDYITQAWWMVTFPGIAITIVVFAFNIFGDGLRDIYDPKTTER